MALLMCFSVFKPLSGLYWSMSVHMCLHLYQCLQLSALCQAACISTASTALILFSVQSRASASQIWAPSRQSSPSF